MPAWNGARYGLVKSGGGSRGPLRYSCLEIPWTGSLVGTSPSDNRLKITEKCYSLSCVGLFVIWDCVLAPQSVEFSGSGLWLSSEDLPWGLNLVSCMQTDHEHPGSLFCASSSLLFIVCCGSTIS